MKVIAVFNNKGGVGKTTLTYHTAAALAELGHKTLLIDLDPQSNLTLFGFSPDELYDVWREEDAFIDDFDRASKEASPGRLEELLTSTRSIHFFLKPTEDGVSELDRVPVPRKLAERLDLIPGRLTVHLFENKIASRWSEAYQGDPLAIRTLTRIRQFCLEVASSGGYEFILLDTSPSLGVLNKVVISTADAFFVPCMPDMFSLYGIRNIGKALAVWKRDFETMYKLLSDQKRVFLPERVVQFLGYTVFNAKKYTGNPNPWDLARAHYNYASQIPDTIKRYIQSEVRASLPEQLIEVPIGGTAVMHSHSTQPTMAQKYRCPIWKVPGSPGLEQEDRATIIGNRGRYESAQEGYRTFARDLLSRIEKLDG